MNQNVTVHPTVAAFAAAVRHQLSDLDAKDLDELTDGLEADLSDRVAEQGTDLGDPVHYAEELRQAAGLPPMQSVKKRGWGSSVQGFVPALRSLGQRLYAKPAGAATVDFLRSLRPVWWVLRGWLVFAVLMTMMYSTPFPGMNPLNLVFFLAALVLSVQWGRGKWLGHSVLRLAKKVISIVAILLLPFLTVLGVDRMTNPIIVETSSGHPDRLMHHYDVMTNIFAYDCLGQPLRNVQLFDQDGRQLDMFESHEKYALVLNGPGALIPHPSTTTGSGWNVYPLDAAHLESYHSGMRPDLETIWTLELPYQSVQPLVNADELCGNQGASGGENGTEDMLEEGSADVALPEDR